MITRPKLPRTLAAAVLCTQIAACPSGSEPASAPAAAPAPAPAPAPIAPPANTPTGPIPNLTDSGPVVISGQSNVVISGLRISNPTGDCIQVSNATNVRIANVELGPCYYTGVTVQRSSTVKVDSSYIHDTGLHGDANIPGAGVEIFDSNNIEIAQNYVVHGTSNVMAVRSTAVNVHHNHLVDAKGPFWRGESVQFNNVTGTNNGVSCNIIENGDAVDPPVPLCSGAGGATPGCSIPEDIIHMWQSQGDPGDPILIAYNKLRGTGRSPSAWAINAIDGSGQYVDVIGNIIVDAGVGGIEISTGSHSHIMSNLLYGSYRSWIPWSDASPMQVWNQAPAIPCTDHTISGNQALWMTSLNRPFGFYDRGGCTAVTEQDNNWNAPIDASIWNRPIPQCDLRVFHKADTPAPGE